MKKQPEVQLSADGKGLISQAKAAEMCGKTRATIYDLVRCGRFRSVEVEGREMVYLKEVKAFEKESRQRA